MGVNDLKKGVNIVESTSLQLTMESVTIDESSKKWQVYNLGNLWKNTWIYGRILEKKQNEGDKDGRAVVVSLGNWYKST